MSGRFDGKVVQITGAASGFGAAAARAFAAKGAMLALSDLDHNKVPVPDDTDCIVDSLDVTQSSAHAAHTDRIKKRWGRLDIAINNAGIAAIHAPLPNIPETVFDKIMAVNVKGVFLGMQHQLPVMVAAGQGAVLNVSSVAGLVGAPHLAAYAASKHAVVGLTVSAAAEVARVGVRVNALCPSFAETPMVEEMADILGKRSGDDRTTSYAKITSRFPTPRLATVDEVVQAMLWACDPDNSFYNGQTLAIDGGMTAI
jgi:NAD(P)-dependent dehydrogenase (short-subunit alcohol dehydrogenase family)